MGSSRQLLLGTGVFLGGGILLLSLVKQMDAPKDSAADNAIKVEQVSSHNYKYQFKFTVKIG